MIQRLKFLLAHQLMDPHFNSTYNHVRSTQWMSRAALREEQEKNLRDIIKFSFENVPYYRRLFRELHISPDEIRRIEDLEKLPIITKQIIRDNWEDLKPVNLNALKYNLQATGGSTGTPLHYRVSKNDRFLAAALLYRGWGYGGYEPGDRMVFLAGASLDVGKSSALNKKMQEFTRNLRKLSSFEMGDAEMQQYCDVINTFRPKFIRGYPSSLHELARFIEENHIKIHFPAACFTTSEKLYPPIREHIQGVFSCDVFDGYGLNDGGLSAFECEKHNGLHVDTERSIMEVVDNSGHGVVNQEGSILATSLFNYAMPLIRYETGDLGTITDRSCSCGRNSPLLQEIVGRSVDVLITPEGKQIHGWFFLYIFWEHCQGIKEYQVVQEKTDLIVIKLVTDKDFDEKQLDTIRDIVKQKSAGWHLEFRYVDRIERTGSGKYKFIMNNIR